MTWLREFGKRLSGLFRKDHREADLDDEVAAHLDLLAEENIRRGMPREEANYAARREFGGVEQIKETYRDRRGLPVIETFLQDLRYGTRMLRKNRGFHRRRRAHSWRWALARPPRFSAWRTRSCSAHFPSQIPIASFCLQESIPKLVPGNMPVSAPDVADFRRMNHVFEDLGAYTTTSTDLSGNNAPTRLSRSARFCRDISYRRSVAANWTNIHRRRRRDRSRCGNSGIRVMAKPLRRRHEYSGTHNSFGSTTVYRHWRDAAVLCVPSSGHVELSRDAVVDSTSHLMRANYPCAATISITT